MALLLKRASPSTDMKEMDSGHKPTSEPAVSGYYETLEKAMSERLEKGDFQLPIITRHRCQAHWQTFPWQRGPGCDR